MHSSGLATPTCTWRPAQCWRRAEDPAYFAKRSRGSFGVTSSCSDTAVGQVPTAASSSPDSCTRLRASARSSASSATASATSEQTVVVSSSIEVNSSALKRAPSSSPGGTGAGASVSPSTTKSSSSRPTEKGEDRPKRCGTIGAAVYGRKKEGRRPGQAVRASDRSGPWGEGPRAP